MTVELRPAVRADVAAIAAMHKASLVDEHWRDATVAVSDGDVVCLAVLVDGLLDLIWVRSRSRSQGIGSGLLRAAESKAAVASDELTLEVWEVNRRAVAFYERAGFSVTATSEDPQTGLDKLVMRKALDAS